MSIEITKESTVEDMKLWAVEQNGHWKAQWRWNESREEHEDEMREELQALTARFAKFETRLGIMSGIGALLGASVWPVISLLSEVSK